MKRVLATLFVLLFLLCQCFAQADPGARQSALSHSDISSSNDVFSLFNNPAGLSLIKFREAGISYSPAPFGLTEMSNAFAAYCEPSSIGSFSAGFSIYGFELYKETNIAFGFSRKISTDFSVGLTSVYHNLFIKNYGSKGIFIFNLGAIVNLNDKVGVGFLIENITRATLAGESNQVPTVLWLGADLKLIKEISFNVAIKKEIGFTPSVLLGTEYSVIQFLKLRIGASNQPDTYSAGIGIIYDFVQADYAITSHNELGFSHHFGLIIRFIK